MYESIAVFSIGIVGSAYFWLYSSHRDTRILSWKVYLSLFIFAANNELTVERFIESFKS